MEFSGYNPFSGTISAGVPGISPVPVTSTITPATSWLGKLGSAFAAPFVSIGKSAFGNVETLASTAGQSLSTILLQKAGLIPKPQQQGDGSTVINYSTPTQGITPPASINIIQPAASGQANQGGGVMGYISSPTNWTVIALIGGAVVLLIMLRK